MVVKSNLECVFPVLRQIFFKKAQKYQKNKDHPLQPNGRSGLFQQKTVLFHKAELALAKAELAGEN